MWSEDGSRIGFENDGWFIINSDGTGLTRLAVVPGGGVLSPSLTRVAFYENHPDVAPYLSVINVDGTGLTQLTELPRLDPQTPAFPGDSTPVWSPDESKLAFTTCAENIVGVGTLFCRLYVVNADGSGLVLLGDGEFPAWSPDGSHLAFTEMGTFLADTGEGNRDMYIIGVDGAGLTRLTENLGTFTRYPSWFQSSNE